MRKPKAVAKVLVEKPMCDVVCDKCGKEILDAEHFYETTDNNRKYYIISRTVCSDANYGELYSVGDCELCPTCHKEWNEKYSKFVEGFLNN